MKFSAWRILASVLYHGLLFGTCVFAPIRTFAWWRGWVLVAVIALGDGVSNALIARVNAGVLAERAKPPIQRGQPLVDRVLLGSFMASFAALVVLASLDGFRLRLLGTPPFALAWVGLALLIGGQGIVTVALRTNAFASMVVRHQEERAHAVVDTGPYRRVRHPMYSGVVLELIGLPLWLGSWAGVVAAAVPIGMLMLRIRIEERFLTASLPDYAAYAGRVRRRLVPGLW